MLILSFCNFDFVMRQFKFLKTVGGKGLFNLFCASLFIVGNGDSVWGWVMCGGLAACGLFFMLVGCACINTYEDKDLAKADLLKKNATSSD